MCIRDSKYTYTTDEEKGEYKLLIDLKSTKWSDGRTVQAADFVYAWKRIIDPEFRGDASSLLYDIRNARKVKFGDASIDDFGASAVDTYTPVSYTHLDVYKRQRFL